MLNELQGGACLSNDASFPSPALVGNFRATAVVGATGNPSAEIVNVSATQARHVRLDMSSFHGACCGSFNEVAFEQGSVVAVPEPTGIALFGGGWPALAWFPAAVAQPDRPA